MGGHTRSGVHVKSQLASVSRTWPRHGYYKQKDAPHVRVSRRATREAMVLVLPAVDDARF